MRQDRHCDCCRERGAAVGDQFEWPMYFGLGALNLMTREEPPERAGLFLPDGTFKPIEAEPPRRMGF